MFSGHVLELDGIWSYGTDFHETVVLNENIVTIQVSVNDGRVATAEVAEGRQDLRAATLPCLVALRLAEKLFHGACMEVGGGGAG